MGLMMVCKSHGHSVGWVIATDGSSGSEEFAPLSVEDVMALRHMEAVRAAWLCEVAPSFLKIKDGSLGEYSGLEDRIKAHLETTSPDFVVTHDPKDHHPDHRALSDAVVSACGSNIPVIFADTLRGIDFHPDICVDISEFFEKKRKALDCHNSEAPADMIECAKSLNRFRAFQAGLPATAYAEAYRLSDDRRLKSFFSNLPEAKELVHPVTQRPSRQNTTV